MGSHQGPRKADTYRANKRAGSKVRGKHPHVYDRATFRSLMASHSRAQMGLWPNIGDKGNRAP